MKISQKRMVIIEEQVNSDDTKTIKASNLYFLLIYGSETWTLNTFDKKVLRVFFGSMRIDDE